MSDLFLLPLIGCWVESSGKAPEARFVYGVAGNLVVRRREDAEACEGGMSWSEADEEGWRRLRLSARWCLVENARTGVRFLLLNERERYAVPAPRKEESE